MTPYPEPPPAPRASGTTQLLSPFPVSVPLFQNLAVPPRKEMVVPLINMASTEPLWLALEENGTMLASTPV